MGKQHSQRRALWQSLPPRNELSQLMDGLTPEQLREFHDEILDTVYAMEYDPGLERVVRAWHRSLRFMAIPGFEERVASSPPTG